MDADHQDGYEAERAATSRTRHDFPSAVDIGQRTPIDAMIHIVGDVGGLQIVDLGCGEGHFGRELARQGARVTGIDPLIDPVPEQNVGEGSFRVLQIGAEAVPLPAASADIVTFIYSLHHMPEAALAACLREAARLLRPAGRLYVAEPLAQGSLHDLLKCFHDETRVRANALRALEEVRSEFEARDIFLYSDRRVITSFDTFAQRMIANTRFNGYDAADVMAPQVVGRFNELFATNGGNFDEPVLVNLFSHPAARN